MNTAQKVIKVKVGLLELAKQLGNVSQAPDHELERHLASLPSGPRCFEDFSPLAQGSGTDYHFAKLYDRETPLTAAAIM